MNLFEKSILSFLGDDVGAIKNFIESEECPSEVIKKIYYNLIVTKKLGWEDIEDIEELIAEHQNTPHKILDKLSRKHREYIKECVAGNPNTSSVILEKLSKCKKYETVRYQVAQNDNANNRILKRLGQDKDVDIREAVAENDNCSATLLNTLSFDDSHWVRRSVASHPNCSLKTLRTLSFIFVEYDETVRIDAMSNHRYTRTMLLKAAQTDTNRDAQLEIASRGDGEILHILAVRTRFPTVRKSICKQTGRVLAKTLDFLYKNGSAPHDIRNIIVQHPSCSVVTLDKCSKDKSSSIRQLVLSHEKATSVIIRAIFDITYFTRYQRKQIIDTKTSYRLAEHHNTPEDILHTLSFKSKYYDDEDHLDTALKLIKNPNTSLKTLKKLYGFKHCQDFDLFRKNIIKHENCPIEASLENEDIEETMDKYF